MTQNNRGKKILLVDDDQTLRTVLAEQLDLYDGFTTIQVGTAAEGLEKAKLAHYDAILLDIGLPDMDGRELCKLMRRQGVRALEGYKELGAEIVRGWPQFQAAVEAYRLVTDHFVEAGVATKLPDLATELEKLGICLINREDKLGLRGLQKMRTEAIEDRMLDEE